MKCKLALISTGLLLLTGYNNALAHTRPDINPNSKYAVKLSGYLDPALVASRGMELEFDVKYKAMKRTNHNHCRRFSSVDFKVKTGGPFEFNLPLDHYLPGECGWQFDRIEYDVETDKGRDPFGDVVIASYQKDTSVTSKTANTAIQCPKNGKCQFNAEKSKAFNTNNIINLDNYTYNFYISESPIKN